MTGHAQPSGIARRQAWAAAFLAAASVLAGLILSSRSAGSSPAAPMNSAAQTATTYQVTLQVGAGAFAYNLPRGISLTLPISVAVAGPQPLAAASVLIQYDPAVLRPTQCVRRPDAPSGYCNAAFDAENGLVRFTILAEAGIMGEVALFDLTFETTSGAAPYAQSPITPLVESLADTQGNPMTSRAVGSRVTVVRGDAPETFVYVGAPQQTPPFTVSQGLTTTVPVWVTDVAGLGSATFALAFDPTLVRPLACQPFVATADGDATGLCALHADHVRANLLAPAGLSGSMQAFAVIFTAADGAQLDKRSPLDLTLETFAAVNGTPLPARVRNSSILVVQGSAPDVPLLRLAPVDQNLAADARATVHVFLDAGAPLHAATWLVRYNPNLLQAESCQLTPGFTNGACNATGEPGAVRMNLLSADPLEASVDVATITFRRHPEALDGQRSDLTFSVTNFTDLAGAPLPYRTQDAGISLRGDLGSAPALRLRFADAPPTGYRLARGASLDLPITFDIAAAYPVGSLTGRLQYNPAVLRPTRCVRSAANPSMGFCNAQFDRTQGIVRFNLLSADGLSGGLQPFTLTVEAASGASAGELSNLNLAIETATGPLGEVRTWQAEDNYVDLQPPVPAPRVLIGSPVPQGQGIYTVTLGYTQTVPVWVEGVTDLGTATLALSYDPAVVRAVKCNVRSDLIPELAGGFCAAPPGTGLIRANVVAQRGFTGTGQLYDIVFAQAPNMRGGESTPLTVTVENFVSAAEIPIPTTVQAGQLDIVCPLPPPILSVALPDQLNLSWPHIALDTCAEFVPVAYYEIWRDSAPYTMTSSGPIGQVTVPRGTPAGTPMTYTADPPPPEEGLRVYRIVAVATGRQPSDYANAQGAFSYRLIPGAPGAR